MGLTRKECAVVHILINIFSFPLSFLLLLFFSISALLEMIKDLEWVFIYFLISFPSFFSCFSKSYIFFPSYSFFFPFFQTITLTHAQMRVRRSSLKFQIVFGWASAVGASLQVGTPNKIRGDLKNKIKHSSIFLLCIYN